MWNDHISASLICMDQLNLNRDMTTLVSQGIYKFHADFMDSTFVPRLGITPEVIKQLKQNWEIEIDSHLMMKNPERCIDVIAPYSNWITLHYEALEDPLKTVQIIKNNYDCKAALAFNVLTDIPDELWFCNDIDGILLMGISPGVLGSKTYEETIIRKLLKCKDHTYTKNIFVDGAVNFNSIKKYFKIPEINLITICGSSTLFKEVDFSHNYGIREQVMKRNIAELEKCIQL